jgi:hypothetical protein
VRVVCPGRPDEVRRPPHWTNSSEVTLVDLDLDLYRSRADRRVELLDQDEFDAHRVRLGYPDALVVHATRVAARLRTAVRLAGLERAPARPTRPPHFAAFCSDDGTRVLTAAHALQRWPGRLVDGS